MARIPKVYPTLGEKDDYYKGAPLTASSLAGLVRPHLHQHGFLCLKSVSMDCTYSDEEGIASEPGTVPPCELIWSPHIKASAVALVVRLQVADPETESVWLRAELYSGSVPGAGPVAWTLEDGGIEWSQLGGSLTPTNGDHGVFYSTTILTGFAPTIPVLTPDPPRPLLGASAALWRVVLTPHYCKPLVVSCLELYREELT